MEIKKEAIDECNRRREFALEIDNNWEDCKSGGRVDRFGYWRKD